MSPFDRVGAVREDSMDSPLLTHNASSALLLEANTHIFLEHVGGYSIYSTSGRHCL